MWLAPVLSECRYIKTGQSDESFERFSRSSNCSTLTLGICLLGIWLPQIVFLEIVLINVKG